MNVCRIFSVGWTKAVHLPRELRKMLAERGVQVAIASALLVACILSTGMGVIGLILGAVSGLAFGIPLIPFTFGVSLPICSSIGAVIGFFMGVFLGWIMGLIIGGVLGHLGYAKRNAIRSAAGCLVATCRAWLTYEFGCAQKAHKDEDHDVQGPLDAQTCSKEDRRHEEADDGLSVVRGCIEEMTTTQAFAAVRMIIFAVLIRIENQRRSACWRLASKITDRGNACSKEHRLDGGGSADLEQEIDRCRIDSWEKVDLSRHTASGTFELAMQSYLQSCHVE